MSKKQKIRDVILYVEMMWRRQLYPIWAKTGPIAGQPRVLFRLSQKDRTAQRELFGACCIRPTTLPGVLNRLETMRYIARNDNPDCRRSFLIEIMEEGESMTEQVYQTFAEVEERMTEGFSTEKMDPMGNMLGRMYENLK